MSPVLRSLEYRHLRAFVTLADELHFHRAAARLHVAQPTLSQTVRQLELTVGVQLFERSTRRVVLTAAGRALLEDARAAVAALDAVMVRASQVGRGQAGELIIGYEVTTGLDFLPQVLREFERVCPEVSVTLMEFDFAAPEAGLNTGATDVAFLRPPVDCEGLRLETLFTEPRVLCVASSHRFAGRKSVSIPEILPEPLIASPTPGVWRDYWLLPETARRPTSPSRWRRATPSFRLSRPVAASSSPRRPPSATTAGPVSVSWRSRICRRARSHSPGRQVRSIPRSGRSSMRPTRRSPALPSPPSREPAP
jgi:DNA-binding transcriptional LysR family regulator